MKPELRQAIYARDHGICGICLEPVGELVYTIDHIHPTAAGGTDAPDNLRAAHRRCNSRKAVADRQLARAYAEERLRVWTYEQLIPRPRQWAIPMAWEWRAQAAKDARGTTDTT